MLAVVLSCLYSGVGEIGWEQTSWWYNPGIERFLPHHVTRTLGLSFIPYFFYIFLSSLVQPATRVFPIAYWPFQRLASAKLESGLGSWERSHARRSVFISWVLDFPADENQIIYSKQALPEMCKTNKNYPFQALREVCKKEVKLPKTGIA